MKNEFIIYKDKKLIFFDTYVEILDSDKWTKRFILLNLIVWGIFGISNISNYRNTGDFFLLCTGVIFIVSWIMIAIHYFRKRFKSKIKYNAIDKIIINTDSFSIAKVFFYFKNVKKPRTALLDFNKCLRKDFEAVLIDKKINVESNDL
jgi:hypothetical protein